MRRLLIFLLCLFTAAPLMAGEAKHAPDDTGNLTVLVDASLMLPMAEVARSYSNLSHTPLTITLAKPGETETAISQGLEAHVVITADTAFLERLGTQGLLDVSSTRRIARTQLALVATHTLNTEELLAKHISFAATLAATGQIPVYAEMAESEGGKRAASLLKDYPFSETLTARMRPLSTQSRMLAAIRQEPALALMLAADAVNGADISVLNLLPEEVSPPLYYNAAVLASESMDESRAFTRYLETPAAQKIFSRYGLQPPEKLSPQ